MESNRDQFKSVTLQDIDTCIYRQFTGKNQFQVKERGVLKKVPVQYSDPESWATMQKEGFLRDKNGKMQVPLLTYLRNSVEQDVGWCGYKANYYRPNTLKKELVQDTHTGKSYEYSVPEILKVSYDVALYTNFLTHTTEIIQHIVQIQNNYWGDMEGLRFYAKVDSISTSSHTTKTKDKLVKTSFKVTLTGATFTVNEHTVKERRKPTRVSTSIETVTI